MKIGFVISRMFSIYLMCNLLGSIALMSEILFGNRGFSNYYWSGILPFLLIGIAAAFTWFYADFIGRLIVPFEKDSAQVIKLDEGSEKVLFSMVGMYLFVEGFVRLSNLLGMM